jgi:hypothetical protein
MKWAVWNCLGAAAWLAGLVCARNAGLPEGGVFAAGDHEFLFGIICGLAGVVALLWANLVQPA